jgi:hypothetical protein
MERQELALRRWLDEHKEYELVESLVDAGFLLARASTGKVVPSLGSLRWGGRV